MDILNELIASMNKEDIRYFKLYTSRTKSPETRKDLVLFDYIRKSGDSYKEDKILKKLYGDNDKNAFYRIKNRLQKDINKCLIIQHYQEDDIIYVFHLLSLVRFYLIKNKFKIALRFTQKAEKKAKEIEHYELLDIIYGEFIKLSHEIVSIDPEEYIKKRRDNSNIINNIREIDDILAAVSYRLKTTQNFSEKEPPVLAILQKAIEDFSPDLDLKNSPKLRFKIYSAVSQILLQKHDYNTLEVYLLKTYSQFRKEGLFNKGSHNHKLQILTFIINALFKNNKITLSLKYAEQLKGAMSEYNEMLYDKYLFFYYNSLVINYSVLDKDKAISILEELKENDKLKSTSFYEIFVYLNLAILWFDKGRYHNAIKNLNKLFHHGNYENADIALKFKIAVAELIIRYELNDFDFLEHKINQLKKDYDQLLIKKEHVREEEFIDILKRMMTTRSIKKDQHLFALINKFMEIKSKKHIPDDTEIINYNNWLRSKLN